MPLYRIINHTSREKSKELLVMHVIIASSFTKKLFGLILEDRLDKDSCFFINASNSIHTMWMRYSLDVLFLDEKDNVLRCIEKIPPFRCTPFVKNAKKVIELYPGSIALKKIRIGDLLEIT
jgi:uncharacterized protein